MSALESTCGGEGPARATLGLVLYRSDRTGSDPVDVLVVRGLVEQGDREIILLLGGSSASQHLLILSLRHVRELVVTKGVVVTLRIALRDELVGNGELDEPGIELGSTVNFLVERSQVVHILELNSLKGGSGTKCGGGGKYFHMI